MRRVIERVLHANVRALHLGVLQLERNLAAFRGVVVSAIAAVPGDQVRGLVELGPVFLMGSCVGRDFRRVVAARGLLRAIRLGVGIGVAVAAVLYLRSAGVAVCRLADIPIR